MWKYDNKANCAALPSANAVQYATSNHRLSEGVYASNCKPLLF